MSCCTEGPKKLTGLMLINSGYNYRNKVAKALQENNKKYINMLLKKGKIIMIKL